MGEIVHRDEQIEQLMHDFNTSREKGLPFQQFIFLGPTGTGKTATALYLKEQIEKEGYHVYYIVAQPSLLFTVQQFTGKVYSSVARAMFDIQKVLRSQKKNVVILDDADTLLVERGNLDYLMYFLSREPSIDWLIVISNKSYILSQIEDIKVKGSWIPVPIFFPPYNANELFDILKSKKFPLKDDILRWIAEQTVSEGSNTRRAIGLADFFSKNLGEKYTQEDLKRLSKQYDEEFLAREILQMDPRKRMILKIVYTSPSQKIELKDLIEKYNEISLNTKSAKTVAEWVQEMIKEGLLELSQKSLGQGKGIKREIYLSNALFLESDKFLMLLGV